MVDGITFDSKREAQHYMSLKLLEKGKRIRNLELQKRYELVPSQKIDGKVAERAVNYVADFVYEEFDRGEWRQVVVDVKGMKTPEYVIKRKLMLYVHGIQIREVY